MFLGMTIMTVQRECRFQFIHKVFGWGNKTKEREEEQFFCLRFLKNHAERKE